MSIIPPVVLTQSGRYVNIIDPQPETLVIEDIAHGLSHINRYTGQTHTAYSVAEHSLRCSEYLRCLGYSPKAQLAALLHDATEAYLGDVSSPLKALLPDYAEIERNFEKAIELRFCMSISGRPEVKMADLQLLCTERRALLPATEWQWPILNGLNPDTYGDTVKKNIGWGKPAPEVRGWFLKRYEQLEKQVHALY